MRDEETLTRRQGKAGIIFQEEGATFQRFRIRQEAKKISHARGS